MGSAQQFPLSTPNDARAAFGTDDFTRRVARIAHFSGGSRVLDLGGGASSVLLAREFGCIVVVLENDEGRAKALREQARAANLSDRIEVRPGEIGRLPFKDGEFDGIVIQGRVPLLLKDAAGALRKLLAARGRLCLTYPVRVGRTVGGRMQDLWQSRLGEPLRLPRECMGVLEQAGYEPEAAEVLAEPDLEEIYRSLEAVAEKLGGEGAKVLREDIEAYRAQGGHATTTFGLFIGRRREPGERPPASRDSG